MPPAQPGTRKPRIPNRLAWRLRGVLLITVYPRDV